MRIHDAPSSPLLAVRPPPRPRTRPCPPPDRGLCSAIAYPVGGLSAACTAHHPTRPLPAADTSPYRDRARRPRPPPPHLCGPVPVGRPHPLPVAATRRMRATFAAGGRRRCLAAAGHDYFVSLLWRWALASPISTPQPPVPLPPCHAGNASRVPVVARRDRMSIRHRWARPRRDTATRFRSPNRPGEPFAWSMRRRHVRARASLPARGGGIPHGATRAASGAPISAVPYRQCGRPPNARRGRVDALRRGNR